MAFDATKIKTVML